MFFLVDLIIIVFISYLLNLMYFFLRFISLIPFLNVVFIFLLLPYASSNLWHLYNSLNIKYFVRLKSTTAEKKDVGKG
jgi:hypothetical protein